MLSDFGTHLPVLLAAAGATYGPILECGAGHYSTPILHALCAPTHRRLLTLEHKADWLDQFSDLASGNHLLEAVSDWSAVDWSFSRFDWTLQRFDVALVDHDSSRPEVIRALRDRVRYLVIHDTEACCYGYAQVWSEFDWVWTYKRYQTWASIAGMGPRPEWIDMALSPGEWGAPVPYR